MKILIIVASLFVAAFNACSYSTYNYVYGYTNYDLCNGVTCTSGTYCLSSYCDYSYKTCSSYDYYYYYYSY